MESPKITAENRQMEQGRAIARGMEEIRVQKERNQAREAKRKTTMIRNAAERELS